MPHGRRSALCSVRRAMNSCGNAPAKKPLYFNQNLSPYPHLSHIGRDEQEDPFHFAPSLIKLIASSPHQEVASHTFSHYYCLERGQDIETFRARSHSGEERREQIHAIYGKSRISKKSV